MLKTRLALDCPKIPEKQSVKIRALLKVEADAPQGKRRSLNIGVVLDRSGSMAGQKIYNVREATKALAERLGGEDTFSLTIFDHIVDTIITPRRMGDGLAPLNGTVDRIEARGNTNLCGGYQAGCDNVLSSRGAGALDRVVLLTDGLANAGVTDPREIASVSAGMAEKGIITSTVGVGADYSEILLGRMAEAGGGNTYFLRSAAEVEEVLEEELGGLLSVAAEGLQIRFEPARKGVQAEQLNAYRMAPDGAWVLGDVYGNQAKIIVLELSIPRQAKKTKVRCGTLHLSCALTVEGGTKEVTQSVPLEVEVVSRKEFEAQTMDPEVILRAVELQVAAARTKAWERSNAGDFEGAAELLSRCADVLEKIGSRDPAVARHIQDLRTEAGRLKQEREGYYTPMMRKQMYTEAHYAGQGKYAHLANMRVRHSTVAGAFPLFASNGLLLTQIGADRYLIDSGWPASISAGSSIQIGSRRFDVWSRLGTVDAAEVSRKVGEPVAGILGADILSQFDVLMDVRRGILALDENTMPWPGKVIPADFRSGVPVLSVVIGGAPARLVLGTGTKHSFLKEKLAAHGDPVGKAVETLLGLADVEMDLRQVVILLGGASLAVRAGSPLPTLECLRVVPDLDGTLGAEFVLSKRVAFSARQGIVMVTDAITSP